MLLADVCDAAAKLRTWRTAAVAGDAAAVAAAATDAETGDSLQTAPPRPRLTEILLAALQLLSRRMPLKAWQRALRVALAVPAPAPASAMASAAGGGGRSAAAARVSGGVRVRVVRVVS
jgi:hypothetical protein